MEGGKDGDSSSSSSSAVGGGVVDRKEAAAMGSTTTTSSKSSSSSSGYFTSVFSPSSMVGGSDTTHSDLYWTKNSMKTDGQTENAENIIKDGKPQENPSKNQTPQNKDGKPIHPTEPIESPYFGSSVHYGGRDFFACSAPSSTSVTVKTRKNNEDDGSDNSNFATRGDWWQGSLYY
uniref:Suppressor protein SRP40-like n=1 Tax=Ananas comosus var. bracteatus TaxID=296719 RepID=A0A6V7QWD5_ANACO